jgi:hypothetical protein
MRALVATLAVACAGCATPNYGDGHLQCAPTGRACPDGFTCGADQHCWRNGSVPDFAGVDLGNLLPPRDLGASSLCASANVLLCEGFEAPLGADWHTTAQGGSVTIDGTHVFRGSSVLHVHSDPITPPAEPLAAISEARTFPINGPVLYVRAWLYLPPPPAGDTVTLVNAVDQMGGNIEFVTQEGHPALNNYGVATPQYQVSASLLPTDRWICLQLQIPQNAAMFGTVRVFIDGSEVTDARLPNAFIGPIRFLALGLDYYRPPALPAVDVWFDEVIVDNKPITCDD